MAAFDRLLRAAALALTTGMACVSPLSEVGRSCPCTASYVCCETTRTCVAPGECPFHSPDDAASADEGSARGERDGAHEDVSLNGDAMDASPPFVRDDEASRPFDGPLPEAARGEDAGAPPTRDAIAVDGPGVDVSEVDDARVDRNVEIDAIAERTVDAGQADVGSERDAQTEASTPPLVGCWDQPRKSNVLVLTYNPYLAGYGHTLRAEIASWNDPAFLSVRIAEYVRMASHGLVNYDIVEFRELVAWPKQMPDAAPLDEMTFFHGPLPGVYKEYEGGNADYGDIFESQQLCNYVRDNDVSEIWLWGAAGKFQTFGFDWLAHRFKDDVFPTKYATDADRVLYERRRKNIPDCGRTVSVLGFSYTYGYDPRLYNLRVGEILDLSLRGLPVDGGVNPFARFSRYALDWPNDVQLGTVAFPPNGGLGRPPDLQVWDYANRTIVQSGADDWYAYPAMTDVTRPVDCTAWGCSNDGFQAWYAAHIPHAAGGSLESGCNNWWKYIADPDGRLRSCSGADCYPDYAKGQSCTGDDQCASRHCRCEGSRMVCSDAAGPACPNPAWDLCMVDEDCQSGVCGCNAGPPPKKCLPDVSYPRDCEPP